MDAVYWTYGEEFINLLNISAANFRRVYSESKDECRITVYTDQDYPNLMRQLYDVEIFPGLLRPPPMASNLWAQTRYVLSDKFTRPTAFIDADVLVLQPFPSVPRADLVVTYREEESPGNVGVAAMMPYNYGVIIAQPTVMACEAFIWMRERILRYNDAIQTWYGNQHALRELVGPIDHSAQIVEIPLVGDTLRVHMAPCTSWNYTPQSDTEDLNGKYAAHFKGDRKELFIKYAEKLAA